MIKSLIKQIFEDAKHLDTSKNADYQYNIFVVAWSIAVLFHMGHSKIFAHGLHFAVLSAAAVFLISKPGSILRLLVFLTLQITATFRVAPFNSNHEIFVLFADFTIIHTVFYLIYKNRTFNISKAALYNTFAPLVRIELIILYFFVVFHKLNTGFFNTDVSCATDFYNEQNAYSILPTSKLMFTLNIYLTIFVEALIPLLLCFRKTRNLGIFVGLIFHSIIAYNPINGFFDISSAIFASYVLFTEPSFGRMGQAILARLTSLKNSVSDIGYDWKKLMLGLVILIGSILVVYQLSIKIGDFFRYIFWTIYSIIFIGLFLISIFTTRYEDHQSSIRFKPSVLWLLVFPVIVFLNGLCPYLGLKTESSYAMFSNLRTEGGISNHFFVPASVQIFDYQKDLVEIVSSSEAKINLKAERNELLVYFQFRELVHYYQPKKVEYIRNGKRFKFDSDSASVDDELLRSVPILEKKFLKFRTINKFEPQPCTH